MSEELYDPAVFSFELPIWAIDKDDFLVSINTGKYGRCLALFTDEDLATKAIEAMRLTGTTLQLINDKKTFSLILTTVLNGGDSYVGFDISHGSSKGVFERIKVIVDMLDSM